MKIHIHRVPTLPAGAHFLSSVKIQAYIYICVYTYVYIRVYEYIYIHIYTDYPPFTVRASSFHEYIHKCTYTYVYIHIYIYIHIWTALPIQSSALLLSTNMYAHVYTDICTYTYIQTTRSLQCAPLPFVSIHTNVHIHTYTHICISTFIQTVHPLQGMTLVLSHFHVQPPISDAFEHERQAKKGFSQLVVALQQRPRPVQEVILGSKRRCEPFQT